MGAWGIGHFDNDNSMDWLHNFSLKPSEETLIILFIKIIDSNEYIDADDGTEALAAAEIIANSKGKKSINYPVGFPDFNDMLFNDSTITLALKAIEIVASSEISELMELWKDSDEFEEWLTEVNDLKSRLM